MTRPNLDYFILDALANDIEGFDDILRLTNHLDIGWAAEHGGAITRAQVLEALPRLIRDHLVQVFVFSDSGKELRDLPMGSAPAEPLEFCYFALTDRGRLVHSNWALPSSTDD